MKNLAFIYGLTFPLATFSSAQSGSSQRIPLFGSKAPAYRAHSTSEEVTFPGDFGGKWTMQFAHPRDFTPFCSSEVLDLAYWKMIYKKNHQGSNTF